MTFCVCIEAYMGVARGIKGTTPVYHITLMYVLICDCLYIYMYRLIRTK